MANYGYARVGSAEQAHDDRSSLTTQRRKIQAAAELAGLQLNGVIEEPGVSGARPLADRPVGGPLLRQLVAGDALIIAKLDRTFRNAGDALDVAKQLRARRVDLIIAELGPDSVTQNGAATLFFGVLTLMAEFEREYIRTRRADGRAAKRAAGGSVGGSAQFGYRVVGSGPRAWLEPDPALAPALATVNELAAAGLASRPIAAEVLRRHGVKVSHVVVWKMVRARAAAAAA